jgi:hypothetical protein
MTPVQRSLRHRAKSTRPKVWVFEPQHQHHNAPDQMIRTCARATIRSHTSPTPLLCLSTQWLAQRQFSSTAWRKEDPRIESMGKEITDEFAVIREEYGAFSIGLCLHILTLSQLHQFVQQAQSGSFFDTCRNTPSFLPTGSLVSANFA